jgi:hypothetical protein
VERDRSHTNRTQDFHTFLASFLAGKFDSLA